MPQTVEKQNCLFQCCTLENQAPAIDSIVSVAAMHSANSIYDIINERLCDFATTPKRPFVLYSEINTPKNAPHWMKDRSMLWNKLEEACNGIKKEIALEIMLAIPKKFDNDMKVNITKNFVNEQLEKLNIVSDTTIHLSKPDNPHAHMLMPLYAYDQNGFKQSQSIEVENITTVIEPEWSAYLEKFV